MKDLQQMKQRFGESESDVLFQARRQQAGDRVSRALAAQGVDQNMMMQMLQAANYDVERVIQQFNLDEQSKQYLRETLMNLGTSLVNPQGNFWNMFGRGFGQGA
jgi:hypothetical protein